MRTWKLATAGLAVATSIGASPPNAAAPSMRAAGQCASLETSSLRGVRIVERHDRPASAAKGTQPALPAHCELIGEADRRTGADGQPYAIRFHLRLPAKWNQRFFFQGGGGSNGVLGDALGNLQGGQPQVALGLGYAVVSTDSGHDNAVNDRPEQGGLASFGFDHLARRNYAFASQARVTEIAKALVQRFYGEKPRYSYFVGCSKGGQEGMAMAERYPEAYNGIMANAPGFALPRAALAQAHDVQVFARLARTEGKLAADGTPLLGRSLSDADLGLVSSAILAACDGNDGLKDGIVSAGAQCTALRVRPLLSKATCRPGQGERCLSPDKTAAIEAVMAGARSTRGRMLYKGWPWDPGIGGQIGAQTFPEWRRWKLGSADGVTNDARNILLGGASLASVFTTPPTPVASDASAVLRYQLGLNLDDAARATERPAPRFPESGWSLMAARSPDRDAFRAAGGRMIVVHGAADPVFSLNDTLDWWGSMDRRYKGHAADFTRVFPVPGMNHCRAGPGTTDFNAFTALVRWVEQGAAPDRIVATAPAGTPWPGRTRPLCPHPSFARYTGGDPERAESFACVTR